VSAVPVDLSILRGRPAPFARLAAIQAVLSVGVAVLLVVSLGFVVVGTPERQPLMAGNLVGTLRSADVVSIRALPVALPAEPTTPIDVPADPYAKEAIVELGRIAIPKLGLDHKLMNGVTLNNIDQGPSHWPGSAYPGQVGNTVIAGHRVTHSHPFRNLDQLVVGDTIIVTARGMKATYAVTETFVVFPNQMQIVDQTTTPILTLFACHPPHSAKQRIVVRGALVATEAV
jgi:sortase A